MKIREITSRSNGQNIAKRISKLNLYLRGWMQYFSLSDTPLYPSKIRGLDKKKIADVFMETVEEKSVPDIVT